MDRRKDMIISDGFNVYPSDLEAALIEHPAVNEAAVVGVAPERWGETPVAFVVTGASLLAKGGSRASSLIQDVADDIRVWANERLGKTRHLATVQIVDALPRSAVGKILKRELRDNFHPALPL